MNYILFNSDGSIKKTNFTDSIQQNDDGSNSIFVSIDGLDFSAYTAVGVFVLPDGTTSEEGADFESNYEYESGETADGFVITITLNETKLAGIVFLTLQIIEDATNKTKYTYRVALTINKSADLASVTQINLAQYNALKNYIDSNFVKNVDFRNYVTYTGADNNVNLGNHSLAANSIGVYYNGITWCGGFGTTSDGKLYVESGNAVILDAPHCYIGSASTNNEIAKKGDLDKLYKHTVQIGNNGQGGSITLVIISKSASGIYYLSDLDDVIQGFVNGFYEDDGLIYSLIECSIYSSSFEFSYINENHMVGDETWSNVIFAYDIVEEVL